MFSPGSLLEMDSHVCVLCVYVFVRVCLLETDLLCVCVFSPSHYRSWIHVCACMYVCICECIRVCVFSVCVQSESLLELEPLELLLPDSEELLLPLRREAPPPAAAPAAFSVGERHGSSTHIYTHTRTQM